MKRYYSLETGLFYIEGVHDEIPQDVISISLEEHEAFVRAREQGKVIQPNENGYPVAMEPPPPAPTEQVLTQQRIAEIQQQLTANDSASVRPLRAKVAGTATPEDETRLVELEAETQALRKELATLNAKLQELSDQPTE